MSIKYESTRTREQTTFFPNTGNSTRFYVIVLQKNLIEAKTIIESAIGKSIFIPRIPL
jgi:hypothetical protein